MTIVAGPAPALHAPRDEWVAWASHRVSSRESRVELILVTDADGHDVEPSSHLTTHDGYVVALEQLTRPEDRADGRLCAEPRCITRLSKYNVANRCFAHDRGPL